MMLWDQLRAGLVGFLNLLQLALLLYVVLTWFMDRNSPVLRFLGRIAEPILSPVRALLMRSTNNPMWGGFAPVVVMLLIQLVTRILWSL